MQNQTSIGLDEHSYAIRAMFYMLTPNETYIDNLENVPDIKTMAGNYFLGFMFIEQLIFIIKYGRFNGRFSDAITSITAGMIYGLPEILSRQMSIVVYEWIYKNFCVYELPWDNIWTYVFTILFYDMMFYWFHRAAHEINIFWSSHQTHHSSEEYNLSTALRQSVFQKWITWIFYMPMALFIRPSIFAIHGHLNLTYQFWIHTELVNKMGPLEYILNTPSHHRVHHGRNPYCIDKNYGGVLIIWDRLFGTFAAERKEEEIAYGLVHTIETFDPIYIQVQTYVELFKKAWNAPSWNEKFSVLIKGPGWVPGSGWLGNHEDLPKVEYPVMKKGAQISNKMKFYVYVHFFYTILIFGEFMKDFKAYPEIALSLFIIFMLFSFTCFGQFFDNKKSAAYYDLSRCILSIGLCITSKSYIKALLLNSEEVFQIFFVTNLVSLVIMLRMSIQNLSKNEKNNVKSE